MAGLKAPKVNPVVTKDPEEMEKQDKRGFLCCGCCGDSESEEDDHDHENGISHFNGMSSEIRSDSNSDKVVEDPKVHSSAKSNSEKGSSTGKSGQNKSSSPKVSSEPQDTLKHLKNDVKGEVAKKISPDQGDAIPKDKKAGVDGKTQDADFPEEVVRRNTLTNSGRLDIDNFKALKDFKGEDGAKEDGKRLESMDYELSSDPSDIKEKVDVKGNDKKDIMLFKDRKKEKDAEAKKSEEGDKGGLGLLTRLKKKLSKSDEKADDDGSEMITSKDTLQLDKKHRTKSDGAVSSEGKDSEKGSKQDSEKNSKQDSKKDSEKNSKQDSENSKQDSKKDSEKDSKKDSEKDTEKDSKPKRKSFLDFLKFKGRNNT